jgi:hypothetical protein
LERRLAEASKLGFTTCIVPAPPEGAPLPKGRLAGLRVVACRTVAEALRAALGGAMDPQEAAKADLSPARAQQQYLRASTA